MARPGRPERNRAARSFRQLRRFHHVINSNKVFGTHTDLPHAVACAQYHYLSNQVGGVKVEYVYENDQKVWVRYPPPRWIWSGTAICGIPSEVSRAVLRGWHANNGVVLGNPSLGFVCTGQTVDGQPGLEGYYKEWDHDLAPEERLQFSPGETCPPFDIRRAPRLEAHPLASGTAAEGAAQLCDGVRHLDCAGNDRGAWPR
jgi:hypothetical protein